MRNVIGNALRRWWLPAMLAATVAAQAARAQDPIGEWRVADGDANVRIIDCGGAMWGMVSWEKTPGRDVNNPDPAKRSRPTLGMPVLLNMQQSKPGRWQGEVYNAENGRRYDATIALLNPDTLHVEGCALGILCGGEDWTRVRPAKPAPQRRRAAGAAADPATAPAAALCAAIGVGPRRAP